MSWLLISARYSYFVYRNKLAMRRKANGTEHIFNAGRHQHQ